MQLQSISLKEYRALLAAGAKPAVRRPPRAAPEEALQRACIEWAMFNCTRYPLLAWLIHVPNGGRRPRGEAGKLKALGVKPGVPDLMLPIPVGGKSGLAIELKSENGRLSQQQSAWLTTLARNGWETAVARSVGEFASIVTSYFEDFADGKAHQCTTTP